jgi:hypothetical protein
MFLFLNCAPVVIILLGTLATVFLSHTRTIRPILAPMTTLSAGSLDTGPLLFARILNCWKRDLRLCRAARTL